MEHHLEPAGPGPLPIPLEVRVLILERLVLELTKHVDPAAGPLPPSFLMALSELQARHPDV